MWLLRLYVSAEYTLFLVEHFMMPLYCKNFKAISFVVIKNKHKQQGLIFMSFSYVLTSDFISSIPLTLLKYLLPEILQEWK